MVAQFRAMTTEDYYSLGRFVKVAGGNDTFDQLSASLDSTVIFGEYDGHSKALEQVLERLHRRAAIPLARPVFNYVLARSGATLLWKILGISKSRGESIINMTCAYDLEQDDFVDVSDISMHERYLLGAEIAEKLIRDFDFDKEVVNYMYSIVQHELKDSESAKRLGKVVKDSTGIMLCAGYSYVPDDTAVFAGAFKRGHDEATLKEYIYGSVLGNGDSRLTYLLNMNRDKSGLYGMLNYYVAVVPPEMRPKVQRKEHKLTTRYTAVITANNELRAVSSSRANPLDIVAKYVMLDRAVSKLQYKNQGTSKNVAADDLSILERVKGKKGQIRMRNLGKRVDYSGRAVVVVAPYLPLDMIKLPECMLPSILEYHVLPYLAENIANNNKSIAEGNLYSTIYDKIKLTDLQDKDARAEILSLIRKHKILEKIPIPLGRQPTLHKLGIQAFYCDISDSQAIEVNPLVCPAFNMDFDGDAGHTEVPLSDKSIAEVRDLMLTTQNIYLPKTGECTIEPRQDMLYGLYMATKSTYKKGVPVPTLFEDLASVREAVIKHKVKCWDTVQLVNGKTYIAGEAAFISCFPKGDVIARDEIPKSNQINACEITSKTISKFINHVLRTDENGRHVHRIGTRYASTETFVGCINHLVELGFKMAYIHAPSMSMLQPMNDVPEYDNALDTFYKDMEEYDHLYDMGFMAAEDYTIEFNRVLSNLTKTMSNHIYDKLGDDNGYVLLAKSGARGKQANLTQMFGIKGMVKKNNDEAFDALLPHCYHSQLTPQEHFIAAYGGRQGQIDKSLKTGDTGYASRQMWHATNGIYITCEDCGTTEGIEVSKKYFTKFVDPDSSSYDETLSDLFEHAIIGRYTTDGKFISAMQAKLMAKDENVESVKIRTPLKCKNVCCAKCYGTDWSIRRKAVVGTLVGILAAQSIGEPAAQLTMKQFQTGGVVGLGNITSAFDKVNAYIHCTDLASASKSGRYVGYDPIAWADGPIVELPSSNIGEKIVRIGEDPHKIVLPANVKLRSKAVKGEGISYKHGDYSIPEILNISGITEAQMYLMYKLHDLYRGECDIMMIHFEILVTAMTRYMIVQSSDDNLKVGQYYTSEELNKYKTSDTVYIPRILSVKELVQVSQDALDTIVMENQGKGLSRVCALGMSDPLEKPMTRMALGLTITQGSNVPGYIEERKDLI